MSIQPGPIRPMRADAARNRQRLLEVAYEAFAAEGLSVPIDEIARRAGVGAGTVYRHFPTKDALFEAIVEARLGRIVQDGQRLLAGGDPGGGLFAFVVDIVTSGASDQTLVDALAGAGFDFGARMSKAEELFMGILAELLQAAQRAGRVRTDVDVRAVKALIVGAQAMQRYVSDPDQAARLTRISLDGLRPNPTLHSPSSSAKKSIGTHDR